MDAIKTYLETMFSTLPQTAESFRLKNELMIGMEEKYNELKAAGKSENEAIGTVISEFGNINELAEETGLGKEKPEEKNKPVVELSAVQSFLKATGSNALSTGLGVFLILLGAAFLVFYVLRSVLYGNNYSFPVALTSGIVVFVVLLAVAAGMIVASWLKFLKFEFTKNEFKLPEHVKQYVNDYKANFISKRIFMIVAGVVICLLSTLPLIISVILEVDEGFSVPFNRYGLHIGIAVFLVAVGVGVIPLIYAGLMEMSLNILLNPGRYRPYAGLEFEAQLESQFKYQRNPKAERIIGTIAAFYWPMVVMAYLLWSFIGNSWSISWIIWPVAALFFGAITGALGAYFYTGTNSYTDTKRDE